MPPESERNHARPQYHYWYHILVRARVRIRIQSLILVLVQVCIFLEGQLQMILDKFTTIALSLIIAKSTYGVLPFVSKWLV